MKNTDTITHTIANYEGDTLSFSTTIDLSYGREGTVRIHTVDDFRGDNSKHHDKTSVHLTKDQVLALIGDLAKLASTL